MGFILFVWWETGICCSYPLPHTTVNSDNLNASNVNYLKSTYVLSIHNFPGGTVVKNLPINVGDKKLRFHPWVGKISWRRKWQPIPVFLLGQSHGQGSLAGYSPVPFPTSNHSQPFLTLSYDHNLHIFILTSSLLFLVSFFYVDINDNFLLSKIRI